MQRALRISGNLLIAISVLGLVALGVALLTPEDGTPSLVSGAAVGVGLPWGSGVSTSVSGPPLKVQPTDVVASVGSAVVEEALRPITRLVVLSIDLSVEVVPAEMVPIEGGLTWQVPAFKVGHAEGTAGAGQAGNAVLLGHVTSLRSGNVFENLDRVQEHAVIQVFSGAGDPFMYRVVSTTHVPRSESDMLQPTATPSVSLITCTGTWLPTIWDYTERLVVRAELSR